RANGEGSIFENREGSGWVGLITVPTPGGGTRRRKVKARTKGEVARRLKEIRDASAAGVDQFDGRRGPTVGEVADLWLVKVARARKADSTYSRVDELVQKVLKAGVGSFRVKELRVEHVEQWLEAEAGKGKARRTLEGYRAVLR